MTRNDNGIFRVSTKSSACSTHVCALSRFPNPSRANDGWLGHLPMKNFLPNGVNLFLVALDARPGARLEAQGWLDEMHRVYDSLPAPFGYLTMRDRFRRIQQANTKARRTAIPEEDISLISKYYHKLVVEYMHVLLTRISDAVGRYGVVCVPSDAEVYVYKSGNPIPVRALSRMEHLVDEHFLRSYIELAKFFGYASKPSLNAPPVGEAEVVLTVFKRSSLRTEPTPIAQVSLFSFWCFTRRQMTEASRTTADICNCMDGLTLPKHFARVLRHGGTSSHPVKNAFVQCVNKVRAIHAPRI